MWQQFCLGCVFTVCSQLSERSKQGQVPVSASATNKARLLPDSHPNFSLSVTRATEEQIRATMLIHYSYSIIMEYVTGFLQPSSSVSMEPRPIATPQLHHKMQKVLDILYKYFDPSGIEDQQVRTSLIRKRQSLFMKQGTLMLVVSVMDRIFQQEKWSDPNFFDTQQKLYRLLGKGWMGCGEGGAVSCVARTSASIVPPCSANDCRQHWLMHRVCHQGVA